MRHEQNTTSEHFSSPSVYTQNSITTRSSKDGTRANVIVNFIAQKSCNHVHTVIIWNVHHLALSHMSYKAPQLRLLSHSDTHSIITNTITDRRKGSNNNGYSVIEEESSLKLW